MRRILVVAAVSVCLFALACERVAPGSGPKSKLNSARCVSDIECGEQQHCVKEGHRADGICSSKKK